jgi:hypothetical protein
LTTSEARRRLPTLARAAARRKKPAADPLDNVVEIHPRGETNSAFLIPEVDLRAALERIEQLEEDLEDVALMRLMEARFTSGSGQGIPVEDFVRELGHADLLDEAS